MTLDLRLWAGPTAALISLATGCGASSTPAAPVAHGPAAAPPSPRAWHMPDLVGACEQKLGQQAPEPLPESFTGVAKDARCRPALLALMEGMSQALGVSCAHCHVPSDYAADTHNKRVANWMARELVPMLYKRSAGSERAVWCYDCHDGQPKLLGEPRSREVAIDWMTTHLVESFETQAARPPKCRDCHGGDLGSPDFRARIVLKGLGAVAPLAPSPDSGER